MIDFMIQLIAPIDGTGVAVMIAAIANIALILLGTVFFSYCIELIVKFAKPRSYGINNFTKITFFATILAVFLLVVLYYYVNLDEALTTNLDGLVRILDVIIGVGSLSSVPFGAFSLNLLLRYIFVLILVYVVRRGLIYLNDSRKSFAKYLDALDEHARKAAEANHTLIGKPSSGSGSNAGKMSIFEWIAKGLKALISFRGLVIVIALLILFAFVLGGAESAASQVTQLITITRGILEQLLPLGMLETPDGTYATTLINNFAIVLLCIFIAFIYIAIVIAFFAFVRHFGKKLMKYNWEGVTIKSVLKVFATVIVATLSVVSVFLLINGYSYFIEYFDRIIDLSERSIFIQLLIIILIISAGFVALGLAILALTTLVGFVFCIVKYAWHTTLETLVDLKKDAFAANLGKNGALSLLIYVIKGIFQFVSDTIASVLGIFVKPTQKLRFVMAHTALGLFAVASAINTLMGFRYFYVPAESIQDIDDMQRGLYWVVSLAIAVALQIAIVVFGLRAGEVRQANKHMKKNDAKDSKQRNMYILPYIFFFIVSVAFAYTNIFSQFVNTARIRYTLFNEVRAQTDEVLDVRNAINNVQSTYNDTRTELANLIRNDVRESMRRHAIAMTYLNHHEEVESRAGAGRTWHRQNDRDRFRLDTQGYEIIADNIVRLIYSDDDVFYRRNIYVIEYNHFWRDNAAPAYTTRSIAYYIDETRITFGGVFDQPHPLRMEAEPEERQEFYDYAGWNALLPNSRMLGSGVNHNAERGMKSIIPYGSKYQLMMELFSIYAIMSNRIDHWYNRAANDLPNSNEHMFRTADELLVVLDRLMLVDGIRRNLAAIYRDIGDSPNQAEAGSSDIIQMADLSRIVESILEHTTERAYDIAAADDDTAENEISDTMRRMRALNYYVETSIVIHHIVAVLEDTRIETNEINEAEDDGNGTHFLTRIWDTIARAIWPSRNEDAPNTHTVRAFRDYAYSITNSDFLLSYDILLRGTLINPHRLELRSIYSSWLLAVMFIIVCIIKDYAAFHVGKKNFYNKAIYNFKMDDNTMLRDIGYFKYEEQLTAFFDMPASDLGNRDSKELCLHRMFIYETLNDEGLVPGPHHIKHNKNTKTEDLFKDLELLLSYVPYKKNKYEQLKNVFCINMGNEKHRALLRTWLGSYTKGL